MDFDNILLEILNEFIKNENIDIEKYCNRYPQYKDALLDKLIIAKLIKQSFREEDLSGKKLGDYILLQELGRGGMGIVFLGIQPALSRLTAIKILPPSLTHNKEALKNFREEAKIIAKFNHPNIVPIYSIGNERGVNYIAMSYINGLSLKDIIEKIKDRKNIDTLKASNILNILQEGTVKKQKISQESITLERSPEFWNKSYFDFIATIGAEIADALNYAHRNGIIHGDIKPSNILLTKNAIPMIVDFGLSKEIKKDCSGKTGYFCGTLIYAAPEQIKKHIMNDKTDIWALGVLLYELLTLVNPFKKANIRQTVGEILKANPLPLRYYNKKIPIELEAIVLKCLEKNSNDRYNSAAELYQDLRNYLELKPIKAKPLNVISKTHKWIKRNPVLSGVGGVLILIAFVTLFLGYSAKINQLVEWGVELQHRGEVKEAEKIYLKALKLSFNVPIMAKIREKAFLGLASIYSTSPETQNKAIDYFKKCLKINSENIQALEEMALTYKWMGKYEESLKCYDRIDKMDCFHPTYNNHVEILTKQGKIDEAERVYKKLLLMEPYNILLIEDYARFLLKNNQYRKTLSFLAKKARVKELAEEIDFAVYECLDKFIRLSEYWLRPINSYEKAKEFLVSKGFDAEYADYVLKKYWKLLSLPIENLKWNEIMNRVKKQKNNPSD